MSEQNQASHIVLEAGTYETRLTRKFSLRKPYAKDDPRIIKAVIPGVIERIETAVGSSVRKGDLLMILEAMKMRNRITAPQEGRIKAVHVAVGEKVPKGQILLEIE